MKPTFVVDVAQEAPSSLEAHGPLAAVPPHACFHTTQKLRMPLGIYNVSITRICDKLVRLCQAQEQYFLAGTTVAALEPKEAMLRELLNYLELCLYAAAEHVDDVEAIANGFFKTKQQRKANRALRALNAAVSRHKRFIASSANAIKHRQSRIRLFSVEIIYGGNASCLHGYFIEGVENGIVGPDKVFHTKQDVFSITTFVWEVLLFLLHCSRDLASFVSHVTGTEQKGSEVTCRAFADAVVAAARLPLYTFGEEHPFARSTLTVRRPNGSAAGLESKLHGSLWTGWSKTGQMAFGASTSRFEGDGVTKSFQLAHPKTVALQHWG